MRARNNLIDGPSTHRQVLGTKAGNPNQSGATSMLGGAKGESTRQQREAEEAMKKGLLENQ
jgi:hypothetical protein